MAPVEARCAELGPRFRFFHVAPLEGFKAGALNLALRQTAAGCRVVAVIDSDYAVDPDRPRSWCPSSPTRRSRSCRRRRIIATPARAPFKAMAYAEYRGFFHVGMVTRNERNAIIQHGTMTLVRRDVLDNVSRWAEWCICEDAELGLRSSSPATARTTPRAASARARCPTPSSTSKKQRFRWPTARCRSSRRTGLSSTAAPATSWRRASVPFHRRLVALVADGFNLLFNFAALAWSILMISSPIEYDAPLMMFRCCRCRCSSQDHQASVHLYRSAVGASVRQTIAAALAGLSLSHTIGLAVPEGP